MVAWNNHPAACWATKRLNRNQTEEKHQQQENTMIGLGLHFVFLLLRFGATGGARRRAAGSPSASSPGGDSYLSLVPYGL